VSTQTIFFFAVGVFLLMMIGVVLTAREYARLDADSNHKARVERR
jgi:hypothetical protein